MTRLLGPHRIACLVASLAALGPSPGEAGGDRPQPSEFAEHDCGTRALYALLKLEGMPAPLDRVAEEIERLGPGERSLAVLRDAARPFGLDLRGLRQGPGGMPPDRPAIFFLDRKPHGHFLVVRPVGHTRRLVQVIDPGRGSTVLDAADLYRSPEWTGMALAPTRPDWTARVAGAFAAAALLASLPWRGLKARLRASVRSLPGPAAG